MVSIRTQKEQIEKEAESLEKLTRMLKEVGALLDKAKESVNEEDKRRLLAQAYETMSRFKA